MHIAKLTFRSQELALGRHVSKISFFLAESYYFGSMKVDWQNRKWVVVLLHALAWLAIFALPFLMRTSASDPHKPPVDSGFINFYIVTRFFWIGFFYLNALYLFPQQIARKKYAIYMLTQVAVLFIISLGHHLCFNLLVKKSEYDAINFLAWNTFTWLFILASSTAYRMILDKIAFDKLIQERKNEYLKTELSFLRSQVSPHFMFNVLNNMVALARKKSDLLEPSLLKLSSLMRYMLYETDEQKVALSREIEYLQSYIDLQQQRFGKNVVVSFSAEEQDGSAEIEPMLLIPFVENAFKHGTGMIEQAQINIGLSLKNNILNFWVHNRYNSASDETKDYSSGIGLTNVQRRLNLLYGKNHSLLITKDKCWYKVNLQLNLH